MGFPPNRPAGREELGNWGIGELRDEELKGLFFW